MNKAIIIFICFPIIIMGCNGNKIIVERTAQELILEFESDWKSACKFYKGKRIEVSGRLIVNIDKVMSLGAIPITREESIAGYMNNNMLISCVLYRWYSYDLYENEIIIIQGAFDEFLNNGINKSIILKKCIVISQTEM